METCTGNAPDSLAAGWLVLPLNIVGFALLAQRPTLPGFILGGILPSVAAVSYTHQALLLLAGVPACGLISEYGPWEPSGEEASLGLLWLACSIVFWLGLALTLYRGYRARPYDRNLAQPD